MQSRWIVKLLTGVLVAFFFVSCSKENSDKEDLHGSFTDSRDGRIYATIKIGEQVWFAENLNYRTLGSWYHNNDSLTYSDQYGLLYDWNAAQTAVPPGWHLPSKTEWETLINHFSSPSSAYYKLISGGSSGFNAMLGGARQSDTKFYYFGSYGLFWSSTSNSNLSQWDFLVAAPTSDVYISQATKADIMMSIRCIQD